MIVDVNYDIKTLNVSVLGSEGVGKSYFISRLLRDCSSPNEVGKKRSRKWSAAPECLTPKLSHHAQTIEDSVGIRYFPDLYKQKAKKNSLLLKLVNSFSNVSRSPDSTPQKDAKRVDFSICEIGGNSDLRSLWNSSINSSDAFILVYNSMDKSSFSVVLDACKHISEIKRRTITDIPILMVENEIPSSYNNPDQAVCGYMGRANTFVEEYRCSTGMVNDARDLSKIYGINFFSMVSGEKRSVRECLEIILNKVCFLINKIGTSFASSAKLENYGHIVRLITTMGLPKPGNANNKFYLMASPRKEPSCPLKSSTREKGKVTVELTDTTKAEKVDDAHKPCVVEDGTMLNTNESIAKNIRRFEDTKKVGCRVKVASDMQLYVKPSSNYPLGDGISPQSPRVDLQHTAHNGLGFCGNKLAKSHPQLKVQTSDGRPEDGTDLKKPTSLATDESTLPSSPTDKDIKAANTSGDLVSCSTLRKEEESNNITKDNADCSDTNGNSRSPDIPCCRSWSISNCSQHALTISSDEQILKECSGSLISSTITYLAKDEASSLEPSPIISSPQSAPSPSSSRSNNLMKIALTKNYRSTEDFEPLKTVATTKKILSDPSLK